MEKYEDREKELKAKHIKEAKRLLTVLNEKQALFYCEEIAKKLPSINNTPPIKRKSDENYMQFYMFGVANEIKRQCKKLGL